MSCEFWAEYRAGLNDQEIADVTGIEPSEVQIWRKKNGLPAIRKKARPKPEDRVKPHKRRESTMDRLRRLAVEADKLGLTYGQYMAQKSAIGKKKRGAVKNGNV